MFAPQSGSKKMKYLKKDINNHKTQSSTGKKLKSVPKMVICC